jgi:hypothetical protein
VVFQPNTDEINITWEESVAASGEDVTYEWLADELDGDFSTPLLTVPSDEDGLSNEVTLTLGQIDAALASIGVAIGSTTNVKWTIRATEGSNKRLANTPRTLSIRRGGLTFIVYVPNNTPSNKEVYLAGQFGFIDGPGGSINDWQQPGTQPALKMNKISDGVYSLTIAPPANNATFEYKYFLATAATPDWGNGERKPTTGGNNNGDGMPNRKLTYTSGNDNVSDVVSIWEQHPFNHVVFKLTAPNSTPAPNVREVFVAGEWNQLGVAPGAWQQPGTNPRLEMTRDFGDESKKLYFYVTPRPSDNISMKYKYFLATLSSPAWNNGENGGDRTYIYTGTQVVTDDTVSGWDGF